MNFFFYSRFQLPTSRQYEKLIFQATTIFSSISWVFRRSAFENSITKSNKGWSSWNTFFGEINEDKVIGIADAIKRLKLDKFGYIYVTIDDFWNLPDRHNETQR